MNKKTLLTMVVNTAFAVSLMALFGGCANTAAVASESEEIKQSYSAADVSDIYVEATDWNVEIGAAAGDEIEVGAVGAGGKLSAELDEGALKIVQTEKPAVDIQLGQRSMITILVPDNDYNLSLNSISCDVKVANITLAGANISLDSGDLSMDTLTAGDTYTAVASGDMKIDGCTFNALYASSNSGDIYISKTLSDTWNVLNTDGEITVRDFEESKTAYFGANGGDIALHFGQQPTNMRLDVGSGTADVSIHLGDTDCAFDDARQYNTTIGAGENYLGVSDKDGSVAVNLQ